MTREEALVKAWDDWHAHIDADDRPAPVNPAFNHWFGAGWDAVIAEIRPLVNDILMPGRLWNASGAQTDKHCRALERLRELVREAGE